MTDEEKLIQEELMEQDVRERKAALTHIFRILEIIEKTRNDRVIRLELSEPYSAEIVEATLQNGRVIPINISCDSVAAMTRDILKQLGH